MDRWRTHARYGEGRRQALDHLPHLRAAFAAGELSWDQVSAAALFATPALDEVLADELPGFTASQIEDMARQRRVIRREDAEGTTNRRRFRWRASRDDSGYHYSGFLPAVEGAMVNAALERAVDGAPRDAQTGTFPCAEHRHADALVELAQQKLVDDPGPDPTMVVIHADAEVVDRAADGNASVDGLEISADTLGRVLCDTALEANVEGPDGTCVGLGRLGRTPPRWLRRRIVRRDEGHCRFPGCGRRIRHVHHIEHWQAGGATDSHNLVGLCWYHHRLVHEGGWSVTGNADGALTFAGPLGRTLTTRPPPLRRTTTRRIERIIGLELGSVDGPDPPAQAADRRRCPGSDTPACWWARRERQVRLGDAPSALCAPGDATVRTVTAPRDVVVVLLDSLNRHLLGSYGGTEFDTPNLDRLAARSVRFTNHHTGSLPCMPARHDLLVGALDFPWRPWGSIEVWEDAITSLLRRDAGVSTMLVSDHPHLFETGGENYHTDFGAWDYLRGHEDDPWRTRPDPSWIGAPALPARRPPWQRGYDVSRTWFKEEADFPGPRTMAAAASWLDGELSAGRGPEERALLVVDEFDPHEPFDVPEPWASRYDPGWEGERLIWPPYAKSQEQSGLTDRESTHLRAQYGAKLSMIDHWLGRLLEVIDRHDAWDTTALILCTDHGHYLGERGFWGKPQVAVHPELGHIPLLVSWPGVAPGTNGALTTTVDLHATLCDAFAVVPAHRTHGHSLVPLLEGTTTSIREWALCGVWGREVHVADARRTFAKAPVEGNRPLSMSSNRWTTMPIRALPGYRMPRPDGRAWLDRAPGTDVPVIRQPFDPSDDLPFWAGGAFAGDLLYDREEADAGGEVRNQAGKGAEKELADLLVEALRSIEAPSEQLVRLGLG